ncbi:hypothetical protein LCGC14_0378400 [marine sediment metagenome]|uniref:LamG-like jellyroll fold domain-containing protein n=1 Tax=marine sediment metagenome TaxID=412755 RepID=A0A0F9TL21_9ZZZZ
MSNKHGSLSFEQHYATRSDTPSGSDVKIGVVWVDTDDGTVYVCTSLGPIVFTQISGVGDVVGPSSATDNAIVRFDGTTGKLIQDYSSTAPTVSDDGKVGIGNTSPQELLHVGAGTNASDISATDLLVTKAGPSNLSVRDSTNGVETFLFASSAGGILGTITNDPLDIKTNNSSAIFIDASQNVGIGTTTPNAELEIVGDIRVKTIHEVTDEGLVLSTNFNTESINGNTVLDSSTFNNHGTNNGATHNPSGGFNSGGDYAFNGSSDFINIDTALTNSLASTTKGTWTAWVKPVDATPLDSETFIAFGDVNANEFIYITILPAGKFNAFSRSAASLKFTLQTDSVVFSDNTWTHVALAQDGVSPVIYIDGVAVAQAFITEIDKTYWFNDAPNLDNGRIGTVNRNSEGEVLHFNGDIDEVKIYNRALSADEVRALYEQRTEGNNSYVSQRDMEIDINGNAKLGTLALSGALTLKVSDNQARWAALYEARLDLLGLDCLLVPMGDTNHEAGDRTTVTTVGDEQVVFTYTEAVTSWDTPPTVKGPLSIPVINFNQSDEWLETPDAAFWNDSAGSSEPSYCWAFWVNVVAGASGQSLMMKSTANNNQGQNWVTIVDSDETFRCRIIDDTANAFIGARSGVLSAGWHHLAATKHDDAITSASIITYIDGEVDRTDNTNGTYADQQDGTQVVRIGAETDGGNPLGSPVAGGPLGPVFRPVGTGAVWTPDAIRRDFQLGRAVLGV